MLFARSALCQLLFYLNFFAHGLLTPVALVTNRQIAWAIGSNWMKWSIKLWKWSTGSEIEFRGLENIPKGGFIVACKHQSTWETLGLATVFGDIVYILKRELMFIPIFGWFCAKAEMIPVDRSAGFKALGPMTEKAREAIEKGRRVVIFMEGTRVPAGQMLRYKIGVARLHESLDCPIVPVALNTGLFWPRNVFSRYQGKVIIDILPPIMPGSSTRDVLEKLEQDVEAATNKLILETAHSPSPPPTIVDALENLRERGVDIGNLPDIVDKNG